MHISEQLIFQGLIALVVIGWLVSRQLRARKIQDRLSIIPIVLIVISFAPPGPSEPKPLAITLLVVSLIFSAAMGYFRGISMKVWADQSGQVWRQGTPLTLGLWLLTIAVRIGLDLIENVAFNIDVRSGGIWLSLAITLGIQTVISQQRARGLRPGMSANPAI